MIEIDIERIYFIDTLYLYVVSKLILPVSKYKIPYIDLKK